MGSRASISADVSAGLPQLAASGVSKYFGGVCAVEDVSIAVSKGEVVSIIGPNGAGKTSLLNMISGFYRPDSGRITLGDRDITRRAARGDCPARHRPNLPEHRLVRRS